MEILILLVVLIAVAVPVWFRIAPLDKDRWHVDPAEVEGAAVQLIGRQAPRFAAETDHVLETFANIALEEPRVRLFDGSIEEGLMTFVARSRILGAPDFITVKAVDEGRETKLAIAARQRFGKSDLGVNAARLDRWLQELQHRL